MHAEPITFGLKLLNWLDEVRRDRDRLANARQDIAVGKLSGPVGLPVEEKTAKFDLTLSLSPAAGRLAATLVFSRDLFDPSTAARLLGQLRRLIEAAAADPGRRLGELPLLGAGERHQLVAEWADTATAYPREATVHGLFARQAAATPGAVAAVLDEEHVTYGELAVRSRRLAGRLAAEGVGLETLVGLYAGRSVALLVGMLATLEAGGAYLPLDPTYPRERLALMLADAGVRVALVGEELAGRLPPAGARLLSLESGGERAAAGGGEAVPGRGAPPTAAAGPDALAYVMYTSGSTGRPKGVAVTHRSVVRLVRETGYVEFGPDEVWLQLAPFSFDAATLEIWGALLHGARLVAPAGPVASLAEIGGAVTRHRVTILWLTAGLFHQMVETELAALASVRQLLAGGDVLAPERVKQALAARPGRRLVNGYGPTENTTFTCCHPMSRPRDVGWTVSLGRPIANGRVFVAGEDLGAAGIGAPGELLAGGAGLARGYHRRPGLTAERFVPDPLVGGSGERLYRTGDRARWLPDGRLEFLGRLDRQVKVRGFRVEPGEVEAALGLHPALAQVAVVAAGDGDKHLAAYYVPRPLAAPGEKALDPADLRAFLRERLPAHMVPTAWVEMAHLPLSPNGKVDRSALPAPIPAAAAGEGEPVPPRSSLEAQLAEIWQEVLGLERVGVHDDFFDLGGHSLKATRVVARVREALAVDLPLLSLLENPTVAELAVAVVDCLAEELGDGVFGEILEEAGHPEPVEGRSAAG